MRKLFALLCLLLWGFAIAIFSGAESLPVSDPAHWDYISRGMLLTLLSVAVFPFTFPE